MIKNRRNFDDIKCRPISRPLSSETRQTGPTVSTVRKVIRSFRPKTSNDPLKAVTIQTPVIIRKAGPAPLGTRPLGTPGNPNQNQTKAPGSSVSSSGPSGGSKGPGSADSTSRGKPTGGNEVAAPSDLRSAGSVKTQNTQNPQRGVISAQNLPFLRRFVTEQGKILSRRLTRVTARQQREITKAIKQARILGYLQFVNTK